MNDVNDDHPARRCLRFGLSRRTRLGIAAAGLIGLGAALGGLAAVSASAGAHMFRDHGVDAISERARDRAEWLLGKLDATEAQEQQVDAIVGALVADVAPLREQHREHRREFLSQLLRGDIDRVRLEAIRQDELRLVDLASARALDAVVQTAAVLTPAQREELLEWVGRRHR